MLEGVFTLGVVGGSRIEPHPLQWEGCVSLECITHQGIPLRIPPFDKGRAQSFGQVLNGVIHVEGLYNKEERGVWDMGSGVDELGELNCLKIKMKMK